jgi:hypothetical protein
MKIRIDLSNYPRTKADKNWTGHVSPLVVLQLCVVVCVEYGLFATDQGGHKNPSLRSII